MFFYTPETMPRKCVLPECGVLAELTDIEEGIVRGVAHWPGGRTRFWTSALIWGFLANGIVPNSGGLHATRDTGLTPQDLLRAQSAYWHQLGREGRDDAWWEEVT